MSAYQVRVIAWLAAAAMATAGVLEATTQAAASRIAKAAPEDAAFVGARRQMVERDLRGRGISDERVLAAMGRIQRERFVPANRRAEAYSDAALKIGHEQTISRPFIVALMTELVRTSPEKRALDIGTGSGYQAAVLAELCREVETIEIVPALAHSARERLLPLGYRNIHFRCGDGYRGWPEKGPFDVIVVAAAPDHIPQPLLDELAPGGRLVIPVGGASQKLLLIEKDVKGLVQHREIVSVKFVPMTGEAQRAKHAHAHDRPAADDPCGRKSGAGRQFSA